MLHFHWDFFGPDAVATAEHFLQHVDEFCAHEGISPRRTWTTSYPGRVCTSLECAERHLKLVRDRLRPRRAERVEAP